MGFKCGIVGLPNVGKSTLFNALTTSKKAQAENFPFCTIDPNVGIVSVPDERLNKISTISKSAKTIYAAITFVDIAGLVKGASKGEGLGNQFLGHIREVTAIAHVLRCFEGNTVTHITGVIDPLSDADIVNTELMLADLQSMDRLSHSLVKKARGGDNEVKMQLNLIERVQSVIENGKPARTMAIEEKDLKFFNDLQLLTAKPIMYVCNVDEDSAATGNSLTERVQKQAETENAKCVIVSAKIESEVAQLKKHEDKKNFWKV